MSTEQILQEIKTVESKLKQAVGALAVMSRPPKGPNPLRIIGARVSRQAAIGDTCESLRRKLFRLQRELAKAREVERSAPKKRARAKEARLKTSRSNDAAPLMLTWEKTEAVGKIESFAQARGMKLEDFLIFAALDVMERLEKSD